MKRLVALLLTTLVATFSLAGPSLAAEPQAGRDFRPISPPLTSPRDKIEVIEFFSYGCNHCSDFHPLISQWAAKLPKDVSFRRVPVSFNRPEWARLARIYYALETTGDLAKLDAAVFIAIHELRIAFKSDEAVVAWAAGKGIDGKKFGDALNSFSMQSKVLRGDQEATAARIGGVPSLAIDGKYLINNEAAANYDELLKLTDRVIAKARQERKGK
jgi:thiol:disulfide interchange protein DsbA